MPAEYLELLLMRELNCTPSELKAKEPQEVLKILTCLEAEAEVRNQEKK
jgi:hypothetical protein